MRPEDLALEVRGIGPVRLPVSAQQAKELIGVARPAKYGLGERTLLDPRVRDTWEIPKSRVKIDNREWKAALRPVLDGMRAELDLPDGCELRPELHSMLVYGPGQHFVAHQDSEKADGMVASLVVTLPGLSTGGTLVVEHGAERATYRGSRERLALVAFYADCRHEIRPVSTGFRVTLTYNLVLVGDAAGLAPLPDAGTIEELAHCLDEHFTTPVEVPAWRRDPGPSDPPDRLVYLFDHEYSASALGWARLKGADAAHAAAIRAAAEQSGCDAVLASADVHETWSAFEPEYRWGRRSPRHRWAEDDEDDEDGSGGDDDYDLDELIDSEISLVHWVGADGDAGEAISTSVGDEEVCASTPSAKLSPYESAYEPYMGNYGNTMDRWYRRAGVVVWPRDRAFAVRAEASPNWALDQVAEHLDLDETNRAREQVEMLAPSWDRVVARSGRRDLMTTTLAVALGVDDAGLASMLVGPFSVEQLEVGDASAVAALCDQYGAAWLAELLVGWTRRRGRRQAPRGRVCRRRDRRGCAAPDCCDVRAARGGRGTEPAGRVVDRAGRATSGRAREPSRPRSRRDVRRPARRARPRGWRRRRRSVPRQRDPHRLLPRRSLPSGSRSRRHRRRVCRADRATPRHAGPITR